MKEEVKKKVKKSVATGSSTVAGAAAGVAVGTYHDENEQADDYIASNLKTSQSHSVKQEPEQNPGGEFEASEPELSNGPEAQATEQTEVSDEPDLSDDSHDEASVISYDSLAEEADTQQEVAVLNVSVNEIGELDIDQDGRIDAMMCDVDLDGAADANDTVTVQDESVTLPSASGISLIDFHDVNEDLPDYINNANVDDYLA